MGGSLRCRRARSRLQAKSPSLSRYGLTPSRSRCPDSASHCSRRGFPGADTKRHPSPGVAALSPPCRGHGRAGGAQGGVRALGQLSLPSPAVERLIVTAENQGKLENSWERVKRVEEWILRGHHRMESHLVWFGRALKLIEWGWQSPCWFCAQSEGLIDNERDNEVSKMLCDAHRLPGDFN